MTELISAKQVYDNYDMREFIDGIESAYKQLGEGKIEMPNRRFIPTENGADVMDAPAYLGGDKIFGIKVQSYSPENLENNLSVLNGIIPLFESETGKLEAIVDSVSITAIRTAAKTAVAVNHLAREGVKVLGLLGMGKQGRFHAEAIAEVRDLDKIIFWSRNPEKHQDLVDYVENDLGLEVEILEDPNEIALNSDILVDATWAKEPLVSTENIKPGTLVIGLFHVSDAIQFEPELLEKSKVYVDYRESLHAGTIKEYYENENNLPPVDLSDVVLSTEDLKVKDEEYTYFQSSGLSIEDVAGALAVYRKVKGSGVEFEF